MIPLAVALTLLREAVRAAALPLHMLWYLPWRRRWKERARRALQAEPAVEDEPLAALLAKARDRGGRQPHLFLSAGETSGEAHAVALMRALDRPARWSCFGGSAMREQGGALLFPLSELAVMGVMGAVRALPRIVAAFASFLRLLRDDPPDIVVLVDYPGFHVVMAKAARARGIPVLHYIAPQYWAWAPWRMRRYRRAVDATLTILPFEPAFFRAAGVAARYVGHPLLDELERRPPDAARVAELRQRPMLCILPGSRRREIELHLPGMARIAAALRRDHPDLRVVLPHRNPARTPLIRAILDRERADFVEHHEGDLQDWLAAARVNLAKSGTVSLEACLHGVPAVVPYRLVGPIWMWLYRNYLSVPWFAGANLVAGREVVPEVCFHKEEAWREVEAAVRSLWSDGPAREACVQGLRLVRERLGTAGASGRAAEVVRAFLDRGQKA